MMPMHLSGKHCQRGVSIISAIFLLLLFAAIAAFMVSMTSTANITSSQDIVGVRTYQAAQAGVEWGLYQSQLDPNGNAAALPTCFADTTLNQIAGFSVLVTCTPFPGAATSYAEAGRTIRIFEINAIATATGSSPVTIERAASARVEKCRDAGIVVAPYDC